MIQKSESLVKKVHPLRNPKFRKAFCLKPGFRYGALKPHCDEVVFATDGYKTYLQDIGTQLHESFKDFDPEQDCIVPTGTAITNLLVGYLLHMFHSDDSIVIAFFQKESTTADRTVIPEHYKFYRFHPQELLLGMD